MNTTDQLVEEIRRITADILVLDLEEIRPTDSFVSKLAGDSLGFLELAFECEKRYGIRLPLQKMFPDERLQTDEKGILTPDSLASLKREFPFLDYTLIEDRPLKNRLPELLTIEAIAQLVARAIAARRAESQPASTPKASPA